MKSLFRNFFKRDVERKVVSSLKKEGLSPITETTEDDVFVIGFPKSGHTWMQYILTSLVFGVSPEHLRDSIVQDFVPDVHVRKYFRRYHERAFFKSHDLPAAHHKNVIYLVRDGRDAMVSYFEMYRKVISQEVSLEDMIVKRKHLFPCSWSEHIQKWLVNNPFEINILIVKYEDLLSQPIQQLERISEFLKIDRNRDCLNEIVKYTHIDVLRSKAKSHGMAHKVLNNQNGYEFFRKGKAKSYEIEMDSVLAAQFEKQSFNELQFLGYLNV